MNYFILTKYFSEIKYLYYFFDGLLKNEQGTKETILSNLGISFSTYRGEKNIKYYTETLDILFKYFNVNKTNNDKKSIYEICLNKIYFNVLYKSTNNIKKYLLELDDYLLENNTLKPIFTLFKVFAYINLPYRYDTLLKLLEDDIKYLSLFNRNYFIEEYEIIYLCIMYYFKKKIDHNKINDLFTKDDYQKYFWIYYHIRGSVCYMNDNDIEALIYYDKALNEYYKYSIIERILYITNNIALIYNNLNQYLASLDKSKTVIDYVYSDNNSIWITYILQNYIYSLFMLKKYEDIYSFYRTLIGNFNRLNSTSVSIFLLVLDMYCDMDNYSLLYNSFKYDKNVNIINQYIKDNNILILDNIENTKTFNDLIEHLKRSKRYKM